MIHITILYLVYAYHTVNRFHWNPVLDKTTIDVDYQGDWNTMRAAPQLRKASSASCEASGMAPRSLATVTGTASTCP